LSENTEDTGTMTQ